MKKKLLSAAIMAALTVSTASALAAPSPITFSGDGYIQYNNTQMAPSSFGWGPWNGIDARLRLNIDGAVDENVRAHIRLVHEGDISTTYARNLDNSIDSNYKSTRIDQAYVAGKFDNFTLQIGRDDLYTGKGMIIDDQQFSGVKAGTVIDNVSIDGFWGKDIGGIKTGSADIRAALGDVNLGANFVKYGEDHFWGINGDTKIGEATLNAEYVKNTDTKANGYLVGVTMGYYTVSYRDIEAGAVTTFHTTNLNYDNSKGFKISARYPLSKNSSITLYQDFATDQVGDKKHRTNIEYDFNF